MMKDQILDGRICRKYLNIIICFLGCFISKYIYILGIHPIRLYQDDIGILGSAAFLAGCDWSEVMSYTRYYGTAYTALFTPLFVLCDNPLVIWKIVVLFNIAIQALACTLLYCVARKYMKLTNDIVYVFMAIVSSIAIRPYYAMTNEAGVFFVFALLVLCLLHLVKNIENKRRVLLDQIIVVLLTIYACLVHSRCIVLWIGIIVTYIYIYIKYRIQMGHWGIWCVGIGAGYWVSQQIQSIVLDLIWSVDTNAGEGLANTKLPIYSSKFEIYTEVLGWEAFLDTLIGNLFKSITETYGILCVSMVLGIYLLININSKKNKVGIYEEVMILFSLVCFALGIVGVAVSYAPAIMNGYMTDTVVYEYKGMHYFRYYGTFCAPAIFVALVEMYRNKVYFKKIRFFILLALSIIVIGYFGCTMTDIINTSYANAGFLSYFRDAEIGGFDLKNAIVSIVLVVLFLTVLLCLKKRAWIFAMSVVLLLPFLLVEDFSLYTPIENSYCNVGYRFVNKLEEIGEVGNNIYVIGKKESAFAYQYMLKDYKVIISMPEEDENVLLFTTGSEIIDEKNILDYLKEHNYKIINLDDNEYVCYKGYEYEELIRKSGYIGSE